MIKLRSVLLVGAAVSVSSFSVADEMTVSLGGFGDPSTFFITTGDQLSLRVTELVPAAGVNTSTHILIEGLSPMVEGSLNYQSTYSGIDVNSGSIQDSGVLYLEMPQGSELPAGTVASPIVGVVQRNLGDWSNYALSYPSTDISSTTGETPTGIGVYDASTITLSLSNGETLYSSAPVTYSVLDTDTILLDPFTLNSAGGNIEMGESMLIRDGAKFFGVLPNINTQDYNSLILTIDLTGIPDLDGDTIPDISDPVISEILIPGGWVLTPTLGYVWGATPSIGYSVFMGWISMAEYPNVYHFDLGWIQVVQTPVPPSKEFIMYSPTYGWIITRSDLAGLFYYESGGWVVNSFLNPSI